MERGRKAIQVRFQSQWTVKDVFSWFKSVVFRELLDRTAEGGWGHVSDIVVKHWSELALSCVTYRREERMDMMEVAEMLKNKEQYGETEY